MLTVIPISPAFGAPCRARLFLNSVHELVTIQNEGNSSVACSAARNIVSMQKWRSMMGLWRRLLFLDPLHPYPHHPEANPSCPKKHNAISSIKPTGQGETRTLERTFSKAIRAILKSPSDSIHSRSEVHHKYQFVGFSNGGKRTNCKMKVDIF